MSNTRTLTFGLSAIGLATIGFVGFTVISPGTSHAADPVTTLLGGLLGPGAAGTDCTTPSPSTSTSPSASTSPSPSISPSASVSISPSASPSSSGLLGLGIGPLARTNAAAAAASPSPSCNSTPNPLASPSPSVTASPSPTTFPAPHLSQTSSHGAVTLKITVDPHYNGLTVYFFRKSGQTGKVQPLGTGTVNFSGIATRTFDTAVGGNIYCYGHLLGAKGDDNKGYSNSVAFKVK